MLRLSLPLRCVSVQKNPHLFPIDLTSKHISGRLYFADRAVKSTAADPSFVCIDNAISCQTEDSNAAVVLCSSMMKGRELLQYGRTRFQGTSAVLIFRHKHLVFQGIGDASLQTFEMSLNHSDIFALLSGIDSYRNIPAWARAVEKAVAEGDVEYVAEEMLLQLRGSTEGCTSVVAKVSKFSAGLPMPPISSQAL